MNNEEKILAILETMAARQDRTESILETVVTRLDTLETKVDAIAVEQAEMKCKQSDMEKTLNAIFDHTAFLTERQTAVDIAMKDVDAVLKEHSHDITKLRAAR